MFKSLLIIIFTLYLGSCTSHSQSDHTSKPTLVKHTRELQKRRPDQWVFDQIKGQTIYFKNGKQFTTNLFNLHYIGQLNTENKDPYLIISGTNCNECDENLSVFIHFPSDGPMQSEAEQTRYNYPGNERDYMNGQLNFSARMFYGNCDPNNRSVVWLQKSLNDNAAFEYAIFKVEVVDDRLQESMKRIDLKTYKSFRPLCHELPGIDVTSEP